MKKKKITYDEMWNTMYKFNCDNPDKENKACLKAVIVFKQSSFTKPYSVKSRSYEVYNCNRCFQPNKISNSLCGYCLDGTDSGVRLDWYNWDVDYCYMTDMADMTV